MQRRRSAPGIDPHRPGDILEALLAEVFEIRLELALDLAMDIVGQGDTAGLGAHLETRRDVDAIAVDIVARDDNVTEMDADAQGDAVIRLDRVIGFGDGALRRDGAFDRIDRAGELDQGAIAHELDDATTMSGDDRVEDVGAERLKARQGADLVGPHEPRIADHVGAQNRRQPAPCTEVRHLTATPMKSTVGRL